MLTVMVVFPELLDLNGDSQNGLVLAQRARWAGHAAQVVALNPGEPVPAIRPDIIVVGSGAEAGLEAVRDGLLEFEVMLRGWVDSGVPVLAVGTGWELLSDSVELANGAVLRGLGLFPGKARFADSRVSDDLVVDSEFGRLIGFENHQRDYVIPDGASELGIVVYGRGNGASGTEGVRADSSIGTHLHGPVLAKNPAIADYLLGVALGANVKLHSAASGRVDASALAARNQIAVRLGLEPEADEISQH